MKIPQRSPGQDLRPSTLQLATSRKVVRRASRIALIVGVILALINHGDRLINADLGLETLAKILLTFCVPYSVSTYSSIMAIRETNRSEPGFET